MQENVRFFDVKLHKNVYFSVCKVHKIAKSVISIGQKGSSKRVKQIYNTAHGECKSVPSVPPTEERETTGTRPRNKRNNYSCARHNNRAKSYEIAKTFES